MATIQIRDVPDDAYETLRRQARATGQSLQAYMREQVIALADARSRREAAIRRLEEYIAVDGGLGLSAEQIVADLDAERR
ncbi:FitA-like ribbon-helix-helix domain-containing protein [Pseudonocardia nigra]|uniref:FitA-like ribbon-helix-helix domain-containing protein n=1 Tax=Pseudonocardia nigra TaxID=1921578 RepID=UPI001C5E53A2|nr:antitoxin [Pseudonocardia nigra]